MKTNYIDDIEKILLHFEQNQGKVFVEKMKQIFKSRIPIDIQEIELAIEEKNIELLIKKSHLIAGSLASLKFYRGFELAKKTENYALSGNTEEAILHSKQITNYLKIMIQAF